MLRVEHLLAGGFVRGDVADPYALERAAAVDMPEKLSFKRDDLPLVGFPVGRAGGLGVGNVLRDDVEPRLLRAERARGDVDAGDEIHEAGGERGGRDQ
jgi:hypothetical protein